MARPTHTSGGGTKHVTHDQMEVGESRLSSHSRFGTKERDGDVTTQPTCPYVAGVEAGQQSPAGAGTE
jgi:hypothetical protein